MRLVFVIQRESFSSNVYHNVLGRKQTIEILSE